MRMNLVNYHDKVFCFIDESLRFRTCLFKKKSLIDWLDDHGIDKNHMTPRTWVKFLKEMSYDTIYPYIPTSYIREDVVIEMYSPSIDFEIMPMSEVAKYCKVPSSNMTRLVESKKFPTYEFYDSKRKYWRKETVEHYKEGYRKSNIIDIMKLTTSEKYDHILEKVDSLEKIYISTETKDIYLKTDRGFEKIVV